MSKKLLHIIDWTFGGTVLGTLGIWMMELVHSFQFDYWIKTGIGLTAFLLGLFKIYDWIEKKCRRGRRFKKKR